MIDQRVDWKHSAGVQNAILARNKNCNRQSKQTADTSSESICIEWKQTREILVAFARRFRIAPAQRNITLTSYLYSVYGVTHITVIAQFGKRAPPSPSYIAVLLFVCADRSSRTAILVRFFFYIHRNTLYITGVMENKIIFFTSDWHRDISPGYPRRERSRVLRRRNLRTSVRRIFTESSIVRTSGD